MQNPSDQTQSATRGQRRHATVFFSDISNSSEHAERLDAESYAAVLAQFKTIARRVIEQHGGSIARLQGDGILAVFGHRLSRETDGRDAVQAALALHEQVAYLNVGTHSTFRPMQMHTGIHAGLVLLLEGDIERGRIDLVGEVPNTAARLCSMAQENQIWISTSCLGREANVFRYTTLQQQTLKGRTGLLDVLCVTGYIGSQASKPRVLAAQAAQVEVLVGREVQLQQLHSLLDTCKLGHTALAHISGEAGVGKSCLTQSFTTKLELSSYTVLHSHCDNHLSAQPHQVVRRWLLQILGHTREDALQSLLIITCDEAKAFDAILDMLYSANESDVGKAGRAFSQQSLVLLALLASKKKLVLVIDDWQWVDDASRRVVDQIWNAQFTALLVLTSRPLEQAEPWLESGLSLNLEPLNQAQSLAAIALWLPNHSPFVAQDIYELSGGNPLLAQELCYAASLGQAYTKGYGNQIAWINALVASRVDTLPTDARFLLHACAVLGQDLDVGLLVHMTQQDSAVLQTLLQALAENGFLTLDKSGHFALKHVLTRDAVYATIHLEERKTLHLRAAQGLEAQAQQLHMLQMNEQLAMHYQAAELHHLSAHHAQVAGNNALALMSLDRARAFYLVTLQALDHLVQFYPEVKLRWCQVSERLGQACVFDPLDVSQGLTLFERAVHMAQEVDNSNALARAHYWLAYVNYGKGQAKKAVLHCEQALQAAMQSQDHKLQTQLQATLGQSLASAGRYSEALPLMQQAIDSKYQQSRPGSSVAIGAAYTLGRLGYTLGDLGRFEEAHQAFAESLRLLGEAKHSVKASVLELMCVVYQWQGLLTEAQQAGQAGEAMALQCRSHYLVAMGRALTARAEWAQNQSPAALEKLETAMQWIEKNGGAVSTSLNYGSLVEAHLHLGQVEQARKHAANLFNRARAQDRHGLGQGCRALAKWAASLAQQERAERYLSLADVAANLRGNPRELALNQLCRAELALS
jgi:class 3 adenylate cyclase/tetratricopeptide (TPR) repeat protein